MFYQMQEVRTLEKERAAYRTRCQKAATEVPLKQTVGHLEAAAGVFEALRLLTDHQKACKESSRRLKRLIKSIILQEEARQFLLLFAYQNLHGAARTHTR